jgi:predicted nucleic acid-binding protein
VSDVTFIDTSALVALFDARDSNHGAASRIWPRLTSSLTELVMTDLIIAETVTVLRRRVGWAAARRAGDRLLSGKVAEVVFADATLFERAWAIFCKFHDQVFSLTDCVSFALMKERSLRTAFSFDQDFRIAGFELA